MGLRELRSLLQTASSALYRAEELAAGLCNGSTPAVVTTQNAISLIVEDEGHRHKLVVDSEGRRAFWDDDELVLNNQEFKLLSMFVSHPTKLIRHEEVVFKIWEGLAHPSDVRRLIWRLRKGSPWTSSKVLDPMGTGSKRWRLN